MWFHHNTLTWEMAHSDRIFPNQMNYVYSFHSARLEYIIYHCWGPCGAWGSLRGCTWFQIFGKGLQICSLPKPVQFHKTDGSAGATGKCWSPWPSYEDWVGFKLLIFSEPHYLITPFQCKIEIKFKKLVCHNCGGGAILRCLPKARHPSLPAKQVLGDFQC